MKVLAVENVDDAEPLEAILLDEKKPQLGLIGWWSNYAWESIQRHVTLEDLLRDPKWRGFDMELPHDWEEGYLRAVKGRVEFVYGKPPKR